MQTRCHSPMAGLIGHGVWARQRPPWEGKAPAAERVTVEGRGMGADGFRQPLLIKNSCKSLKIRLQGGEVPGMEAPWSPDSSSTPFPSSSSRKRTHQGLFCLLPSVSHFGYNRVDSLHQAVESGPSQLLMPADGVRLEGQPGGRCHRCHCPCPAGSHLSSCLCWLMPHCAQLWTRFADEGAAPQVQLCALNPPSPKKHQEGKPVAKEGSSQKPLIAPAKF